MHRLEVSRIGSEVAPNSVDTTSPTLGLSLVALELSVPIVSLVDVLTLTFRSLQFLQPYLDKRRFIVAS